METTLKISGMNCEACVGHVTRALQNVDGVERAMVDLATNKAIVEHNDSVSTKQLVEAIVEDGYEAQEM